jgi:hypothetical protein
MKVIVIMTDGQNTNTYAVRNGYRVGASNYGRAANGQYYYYLSTRSGDKKYYSTTYNNWYSLTQIGGKITYINYQDLWNTYTIQWYNNNITSRASGSINFYNNAVSHTSYGEKDDHLKLICNAAKAKKIVIYTIGFEAPSSSKTLLRDCASSDAYYYDANGAGIEDAFAGIASSINSLRLTN